MADNNVGKPGLTTFGWLALLGAGAAYLSNKDRRDKVLGGLKGVTDKLNPQASQQASGGGSDTTSKS